MAATSTPKGYPLRAREPRVVLRAVKERRCISLDSDLDRAVYDHAVQTNSTYSEVVGKGLRAWLAASRVTAS